MCLIKISLILKLNVEVETTLLLEILVFPVSPGLYNSFGISFVCLGGLMINGSELFQFLTGIVKDFVSRCA